MIRIITDSVSSIPADVAAADACKVEHDLSEETYGKLLQYAEALFRAADQA